MSKVIVIRPLTAKGKPASDRTVRLLMSYLMSELDVHHVQLAIEIVDDPETLVAQVGK